MFESGNDCSCVVQDPFPFLRYRVMNYPRLLFQNELDSNCWYFAHLDCFYPLYIPGYLAGSENNYWGTSTLRGFRTYADFIMTFYLKLISSDDSLILSGLLILCFCYLY